MSFAVKAQWMRHQAAVKIEPAPSGEFAGGTVTRIQCSRCGIELPISVVPGQVVLTKDDRLFLGDDRRAKDCQ